MTYCEYNQQAGDIYTKPFIETAEWESVCDLIGVTPAAGTILFVSVLLLRGRSV